MIRFLAILSIVTTLSSLPTGALDSKPVQFVKSGSADQKLINVLKMIPSAENEKRRELIGLAHIILIDAHLNQSEKERYQLGQQVAQLLPKVLHSPQEIEALLGNKRRTSRQILFRRFIETWRYETPLPLEIRIDYPLGRAPSIKDVRVTKPHQP